MITAQQLIEILEKLPDKSIPVIHWQSSMRMDDLEDIKQPEILELYRSERSGLMTTSIEHYSNPSHMKKIKALLI